MGSVWASFAFILRGKMPKIHVQPVWGCIPFFKTVGLKFIPIPEASVEDRINISCMTNHVLYEQSENVKLFFFPFFHFDECDYGIIFYDF